MLSSLFFYVRDLTCDFLAYNSFMQWLLAGCCRGMTYPSSFYILFLLLLFARSPPGTGFSQCDLFLGPSLCSWAGEGWTCGPQLPCDEAGWVTFTHKAGGCHVLRREEEEEHHTRWVDAPGRTLLVFARGEPGWPPLSSPLTQALSFTLCRQDLSPSHSYRQPPSREVLEPATRR